MGERSMTTSQDEARAEYLRLRLAGRKHGRRTALPHADRSAPLPLSSGQQQMWFLNQLDPESPEYLVPMALRFTGPLDGEALLHAWTQVLDRHEILRTRYAMGDEGPVQTIHPDGPRDLPRIDLSTLRDDAREAEVLRILTEQSSARLDLAHDWPVRGGLIHCAPDDHVLVLVAHHIVCDAWSTRLFAQEMGALYRAAVTGASPGLSPLEIQYADYAAWEQQHISGPAGQRHLAYWRTHLADLPVLDLPTDRRRPARRDHTADAVRSELPTALTDRVRALAGRYDTTPFVVLLTAFQTLLARHTGSTDLAVGTVVSGRTRPEVQHLIGYGINSLVLRARWRGNPSFGTLLRQARRTVLDAFDHQEAPFPVLARELAPERDMSRTPLFQSMFMMRETATEDYGFPGVDTEALNVFAPRARFDLGLTVEEGPDGTLTSRLEYATALFDRTTAERLLRQYHRLLRHAVDEPGTPLSHLDVSDEGAVTRAPGPQAQEAPRCLHSLFEEQARRTPDAVAVVAAGTSLTYGELDARANRVAHRLRGLGAGPESLVGVCLTRGAELVPALLGVLKAGAAYLPLDPSHPRERLRFALRDAGASVVLAQSSTADLLNGTGAEIVVLDDDQDPVRTSPADAPVTGCVPDNLVYAIYTSGSTGLPKGVALTHTNVHRLLTNARRHLAFGEGDVWSMTHSYAFDVAVFEMWGALLHGGRLVVVPHEVSSTPQELIDLLAAEGVTVLSQTPSAFRGLVAAAEAEEPRLGRLALRTVIFAGERLDMSGLRPWTDRFGLDGPALVNMYGITETTVHTTFHRVTRDDLDPLAANAVGLPLDDLTVHLLDDHGCPVPDGGRGEIHVGGPGVARGYPGRPELTAERFVPDPFGPPGARLYRSGDLARRGPEGRLQFLGRTDDQVKVRGYRVEPGEIATVLREHPAVGQAVVVVDGTATGDHRLIGYVVPQGDSAVKAEVLAAHCAARLPPYMVPVAFVPLDELPLNANGKLDRDRLPRPDRSTLLPEAVYVAPRSGLEERVAGVWGEVLGVERVGVFDGFFDLGGDSIRAVALVGALRAAGLSVSVRDVFGLRTVAGLCEVLADRPAAESQESVAPFALVDARDRELVPDGAADAYPMASAQIGMVVDMLTRDRFSNYHNVATTRMRDDREFSVSALREAAQVVVGRHEVLRTSFDLHTFSVPMQLVHPTATVPVVVRDRRGLDAAALRADFDTFHDTERAHFFDLAEPPMMRLTAHVSDDGWWLSITEFHAIVEGWSYHSLMRELIDCYLRIRDGRAVAPRPPVAVRYADSIAGELRALASSEDRAYWTRTVETHPRFSLPAEWGDPREPVRTYWESVPFDDLEDGLRALAASANASLKSVLVAAYGKVLGSLTDQRRFSAGVVVHTRPEALGADHIYGMHLNTVPFAFERAGGTWREWVRQVFDREMELWPHRRFPMPEIQRMAGGGRLVNVLINHVDFDRLDDGVADLGTAMAPGTTEFDLAVTTLSRRISLKSHTGVLSRANAARVAAMFRAVLEAMVADGDGDAGEVFLPSGEREVLAGLRAAELGGPEVLVPELLAERVRLSPVAVAVSAGGVELSYGEVEERANRLAHVLRGAGVGAETLVGVCLERGVDLVVALWAVWKAGGAYVPMDPAFPLPRLRSVVRDAGIRAVLTGGSVASVVEGALGSAACVRVDGTEAARTSASETVGSVPFDPQPLDAPLDPDQLAYVIHTSGSTGRPKGVQVTHRGLAHHVRWAAQTLTSHGEGGSALFSSVAFDLVVPNLWATLVSGQRLWMWPENGDLADLADDLCAAGPFSFLKLTPSHLEVLASRLDGKRARALAETVLSAGETLTGSAADRWLGWLGPGRLINEYGPTETTVGASVMPVNISPAPDRVPIGRPLPGVSLHTVDEGLRSVPVGVVGELCVGGVGVARGYLGRPELTAERFVPDPFGRPGARLYRTGDLARVLFDGTVEFVGRTDDQVKIRGHRVEPGEAEAALVTLPGVAEACVVVSTLGRSPALVAYVVPAEGVTPDGAELRAALERTLPSHLVPAAFMPLDELPLNANGKLDRAALPAPDGESLSTAHVGPRSGLEERVAGVWGEVLGVERVGVFDGFFDLGGDSIRAVALVGALRAAGLSVSVRDVFGLRTVAGLCEVLADRPAAESQESVAPFALVDARDRELVPDGVVDAYPMAQTQLGMVVEMLSDDSLHPYHSVSSFRIRDEHSVSLEALRRAAQTVVERHEALRTSFDLHTFSIPMQLVHPAAEVPVRLRDLGGLTAEQIRNSLDAYQSKERDRPFDLASPPLLRLCAHQEGDGAWWLTVVRCHAISEGWSHYNLLVELLGCYEEVRNGTTPTSPPPAAVRYADFVAGELRALASPDDRSYWSGVIEGYPRFTLPADWGTPGAARERVRLRVPVDDLTDGLRAFASRSGVSLKSVLLAAHLKVLGSITEEETFCTGLVCDARPEALGADRVYGMYLNTVPFASDRAGGTWREWVRQVFDREVELWPHRRFPMPEIQRMAGEGRLVDVSFNYLDFSSIDTGRIDVNPTLAAGATEFDLAVTAQAGHIGLSTHTGVLSRANAARVAAMFRAVLEAMVADGDGDAGEVFLPSGEREVLAGLRAAELGGPEVLVPELLAERVRLSPVAVAVSAGGVELSYGEVEERANRLAHVLRGAGVGAETLVGVCLERGVDLVVALWAVWKAGGAYVPMDPAFPLPRLRSVVRDAGIRAVLTGGSVASVVEGALGSAACVRVDGTEAARTSASETVGSVPFDPQPLDAPLDPDQLAYVIHTSGSTGRPKGVQVTHRGLANRVRWAVEAIGLRADDRTLHKTAPSFDAAVWEIFAPLVSGGTLVLAPPGAERDPETMNRALADERVTVLQAVPTVLRALVESPRWADGTALRLVFSAGEPLDADLARRIVGGRPLALWNTYGPTECTIDATAHRYDPGQETGPVPIGRPLPGVSSQVLDGGLRSVPVGVVGELCVGGVGVARGYLGRPELTAERFVPDPFGRPGARLYRTGDLARVLFDGTVEFVGRADDQVKVNGVRVEPGEVAVALRALPGVADAAVVPRDDEQGNRRLVAYTVPSGPDAPDGTALRRALTESLPAALVPAVFVGVERIPLTASGKTDHRALPALPNGPRKDHVEPRTATERALADIWSRVLRLERVGAHDRFFENGGDSLRITRVIAAAHRQGMPLTLRMLYEHDVLSDLAAVIDSLVEGRDTTMVSDLTPATDTAPVPSTGRSRPDTAPSIPEDAVLAAMDRHAVPGVGLALLRGGEVTTLAGYGVTAADRPAPVTASTPFQVASISKHVTVLGVLRLVADKVLNLDEDIDHYLTSWQVPRSTGITLRELLSHQAGLSHVPPTNHLPGTTMPTIPEVLRGAPPATNEPVRAEHRAGQVFKKTNINFSVLEQLLEDVTGERFGPLMQRLVLDPLKMADSSFDQAHPDKSPVPVAIGHDANGTPIAGRWRVRNEVAAGGLWASARDLAKVALEIRRAHNDDDGVLLTRPLARQMVMVWHPGSYYGLGSVVDDSGGDHEFGHGGRTVGYRNGTFTQLGTGDGLVILTNGESGKHIQTFVADHIRAPKAGLGTGRGSDGWANAVDEPVEGPRRARSGGAR
ncbi:amino acid adenylation domain-containing protein [Streptomyces sp. DSM 118878]